MVEDSVPFIHPYIYMTKKFLAIIKRRFDVTIAGILRLALNSLKREDRKGKFIFKMNYVDSIQKHQDHISIQ